MNDNDPLKHAPKPAGVGLGADGEAATAVADRPPHDSAREAAAREAYDAPPGRFNGDAPAEPAEPGIGDLLKNLRDESLHLIRQEVNLAKTEASEKANFYVSQARDAAVGGAVLAVGGLGLLAAASFLVGALLDVILPLNASAANGFGFLIVGLIATLVGYSMYAKSKRRLTQEPLTPDRTLQSLKDDKQWLTNKTAETTHAAKHATTR